MHSLSEPKQIDLTSVNSAGLSNLIANLGKHGRKAEQAAVVREKWRRGIARRKDYSALVWNRTRVEAVISYFVKVSRQISDSQSVYFTNAGGGVWKSKSDVEYRWIDTYTAVKLGGFNATFACHVREPGDDPVFILSLKSSQSFEEFSYAEIDIALIKWKEIVGSVIH